jgi:hypothetical protein
MKMIGMLVVLMMLMLCEEYNFEGNHGLSLYYFLLCHLDR